MSGPIDDRRPSAAEVALYAIDLRRQIEELEELIRWLAKSYQYEEPATGEIVTNDPIFSFEDLYGNKLEQSKRLSETWSRVVKSSATRSK